MIVYSSPPDHQIMPTYNKPTLRSSYESLNVSFWKALDTMALLYATTIRRIRLITIMPLAEGLSNARMTIGGHYPDTTSHHGAKQVLLFKYNLHNGYLSRQMNTSSQVSVIRSSQRDWNHNRQRYNTSSCHTYNTEYEHLPSTISQINSTYSIKSSSLHSFLS